MFEFGQFYLGQFCTWAMCYLGQFHKAKWDFSLSAVLPLMVYWPYWARHFHPHASREPKLAQLVAPAFKTPPKSREKDNMREMKTTCAKCWTLRPSGSPPFGAHPSWALTFSRFGALAFGGSHPAGFPLFGAHPFGPTPVCGAAKMGPSPSPRKNDSSLPPSSSTPEAMWWFQCVGAGFTCALFISGCPLLDRTSLDRPNSRVLLPLPPKVSLFFFFSSLLLRLWRFKHHQNSMRKTRERNKESELLDGRGKRQRQMLPPPLLPFHPPLGPWVPTSRLRAPPSLPGHLPFAPTLFLWRTKDGTLHLLPEEVAPSPSPSSKVCFRCFFFLLSF